MDNDFEINQAAKMLLTDIIRLNISFNEAWENYNKTWYDGSLLESDKENVLNLISNTIDSIK